MSNIDLRAAVRDGIIAGMAEAVTAAMQSAEIKEALASAVTSMIELEINNVVNYEEADTILDDEIAKLEAAIESDSNVVALKETAVEPAEPTNDAEDFLASLGV